MRMLWSMVKKIKPARHRYEQEILFLQLRALLFGAAGALVWCFVRLFAFHSLEWLVCFIGYPAVFGALGGLLFLYQGKHIHSINSDTEETE